MAAKRFWLWGKRHLLSLPTRLFSSSPSRVPYEAFELCQKIRNTPFSSIQAAHNRRCSVAGRMPWHLFQIPRSPSGCPSSYFALDWHIPGFAQLSGHFCKLQISAFPESPGSNPKLTKISDAMKHFQSGIPLHCSDSIDIIPQMEPGFFSEAWLSLYAIRPSFPPSSLQNEKIYIYPGINLSAPFQTYCILVVHSSSSQYIIMCPLSKQLMTGDGSCKAGK